MFDSFRNGGQAIDFEIFFTQQTGVDFAVVENYAWTKLIKDGRKHGFEITRKVDLVEQDKQ